MKAQIQILFFGSVVIPSNTKTYNAILPINTIDNSSIKKITLLTESLSEASKIDFKPLSENQQYIKLVV